MKYVLRKRLGKHMRLMIVLGHFIETMLSMFHYTIGVFSIFVIDINVIDDI